MAKKDVKLVLSPKNGSKSQKQQVGPKISRTFSTDKLHYQIFQKQIRAEITKNSQNTIYGIKGKPLLTA